MVALKIGQELRANPVGEIGRSPQREDRGVQHFSQLRLEGGNLLPLLLGPGALAFIFGV